MCAQLTTVYAWNSLGNVMSRGPMKVSLYLCLSRSFTWVLWERGQLGRYFEGDDLPGYTLYTATWGLIAPALADAYPGNRRMGVQVLCPFGTHPCMRRRHHAKQLPADLHAGCPYIQSIPQCKSAGVPGRASLWLAANGL